MRLESEALFLEAFVERIMGRDPSGPDPDAPADGPVGPGPKPRRPTPFRLRFDRPA